MKTLKVRDKRTSSSSTCWETNETFAEYDIDDSVVSVVIEGSNLIEFASTISRSFSNSSIGGPIESSIAIAISRSSGTPVVIRENSMSEDSSTQKISFKILDQEEDNGKREEQRLQLLTAFKKIRKRRRE
jgi:hypothetical protein